MGKKMYNVFMSRWSVFHVPIHSVAFATDKQFCWREMDEGIKKDLWSKAYYQAFFWVLIDLIVELLGLIIKPFDNQTES